MSCSQPPVGLVIALRRLPDGYTDVRWDLERKPPQRSGYVIAAPIPEGFLISQLRVEFMVAVSTWSHKLGEWSRLHPGLPLPR